jgi:hypothetical protein
MRFLLSFLLSLSCDVSFSFWLAMLLLQNYVHNSHVIRCHIL